MNKRTPRDVTYSTCSFGEVYNTSVSPTFDKLDGLKGPSLTTCPAQYDIIPVSTVPEEPRRGGMMPLRPQVPMQHALSMTQATDKEAFEGRHAANDLEAGSNHNHHFNALRLSRSGLPSFHPVASTHADLPDATSQHQPTYTLPPSDTSVLYHPRRHLSASHSTTPRAEMNYPTVNYPYQATGESDEYAPSCDFLYPFVDLRPTVNVPKYPSSMSYSDATYGVALVNSRRPSTGSSSMSTPQLTASSGREASCSPLSTYDETPSPRVDSIDYATVAGGTQVYTAPTAIFDWEYGNIHGTQYSNPALNGAAPLQHPTHPEYNPEYWSFQGAALQGCLVDSNNSSAPMWPQESCGAPMQDLGQPLTAEESLLYWTAMYGQSHLCAQPLEQVSEPPSLAFDIPASQTNSTPDEAGIHHPRPKRGWLTHWQTATDFDAEEFLASLSRKSISSATPPQPTFDDDINAMDQDDEGETDEDQLSYLECDDSDEMDADWEIEGNSSPETIESPNLFFDSTAWSSSGASAEVDIGQGIGLGFSSRTLGPDSILCQPVHFSDEADTSWMEGLYQFSPLSPSSA